MNRNVKMLLVTVTFITNPRVIFKLTIGNFINGIEHALPPQKVAVTFNK